MEARTMKGSMLASLSRAASLRLWAGRQVSRITILLGLMVLASWTLPVVGKPARTSFLSELTWSSRHFQRNLTGLPEVLQSIGRRSDSIRRPALYIRQPRPGADRAPFVPARPGPETATARPPAPRSSLPGRPCSGAATVPLTLPMLRLGVAARRAAPPVFAGL